MHLMLGIFVFVLTFTLLLIKKPLQQSMTCMFSKDEPMRWRQIQTIADIVHRNTVSFDWRTGDMLILDNHLVSHGRTPFRKL
eukprot:ANDGO_04325.mRNA.1 hypothetical protein